VKGERFCAVIGDINGSRELPDRIKIQRKFHRAIEIINAEYKKDIASKFVLTLGDEFQGLLASATDSYRLARRFQDIMGQIPFAFGIGIGGISTRLNPKGTMDMDGECFHRARAALLCAKKAKRSVVFDFESSGLSLVNAVIASMEKGWKLLNPTQKQIVDLMKLYSHQETVAKKLNITQQYVSKAMRTTIMQEMNEAENALREFLSSHLQQ
jgi:hypothetical protein